MTATFTIPADNRDLSIANLVQFLTRCLPGKPVDVVIDQHRNKRSNPQNHALFGVAYPPIMAHMGLRGDREKEELHEFWCGEYFGWATYTIMGQTKKRPSRTTTTDENGKRAVMTTIDFMDFYEFVQQRCVEFAIKVPDPDPEYFRRDARDREQMAA